MADPTLEQHVVKIQKLIKAHAQLKKENSQLKKQLSLAEMEQERLGDKRQQSKAQLDSLINQLSLLEGQA